MSIFDVPALVIAFDTRSRSSVPPDGAPEPLHLLQHGSPDAAVLEDSEVNRHDGAFGARRLDELDQLRVGEAGRLHLGVGSRVDPGRVADPEALVLEPGAGAVLDVARDRRL